MAEVRTYDGFLDAAASISSKRLSDKIAEFLRSLELFPEMGSRDVPGSVRARYGSNIRKIALNPFDVIYEYDERTDVVHVYDLVHQKLVR